MLLLNSRFTQIDLYQASALLGVAGWPIKITAKVGHLLGQQTDIVLHPTNVHVAGALSISSGPCRDRERVG